MSNTSENFLTAALVASELYRARTIAEELSITSKNARAIAARAGSTAAGFNEITNFIEKLAIMTITTAKRVNDQAVKLTRLAAICFRTEIFLARLNRSLEAAHCQESVRLKQLAQQTAETLDQIRTESHNQATRLSDELEETQRELRSTKIVTVVARVESARADEKVRASLNAVADQVADAGERINAHIRHALVQLKEEL